MKELIDSITKSIETENWYAAMFVALSLPDICGSIDTPLKKPKVRYVAWFNKYMDKYNDILPTRLNGEEYYFLRCAFFHQFSDKIDFTKTRSRLGKFDLHVCDLPNTKINFISTVKKDSSTLMIDVIDFCTSICEATKVWIQDNGNSKYMSDRINNLLEIKSLKKEGRLTIDGVPMIGKIL
jgi:hypothetical protein